MKRTLAILFNLAIAITALAGSPKLASEKIFDDIDVYDPSLSLTIIEKKNKTVKSVTFKNNPELLKKIKKALTSDKEKAESKTFSSVNGEISEYIDITTDDERIKIGMTQSRSNETYFFITINPKTQQNSNNNSTRSSSRKTKTSKKTSKTNTSKKTNRSIQVMTDNDDDSNETIIYVYS